MHGSTVSSAPGRNIQLCVEASEFTKQWRTGYEEETLRLSAPGAEGPWNVDVLHRQVSLRPSRNLINVISQCFVSSCS